MPQCGYCGENFPTEHLYGIAPGGVRQCPPCIEDWCDDWEGDMKVVTDTIRQRNQEPLTRFLEWQDGQRHEKRGRN